jgi:pilus assembly protein Flp/PilA
MGHGLERGQGLLEYALIMMLVAIVVILAVTLFGDTLTAMYENIVAEIGVL